MMVAGFLKEVISYLSYYLQLFVMYAYLYDLLSLTAHILFGPGIIAAMLRAE